MEIDRRDLVRYGGTGVLTAAILLVLVGSGWALIRGKSPADTTLDNMRRMPLIGLVIAENPDAASRMRKAIEDEEAELPGADVPKQPKHSRKDRKVR